MHDPVHAPTSGLPARRLTFIWTGSKPVLLKKHTKKPRVWTIECVLKKSKASTLIRNYLVCVVSHMLCVTLAGESNQTNQSITVCAPLLTYLQSEYPHEIQRGYSHQSPESAKGRRMGFSGSRPTSFKYVSHDCVTEAGTSAFNDHLLYRLEKRLTTWSDNLLSVDSAGPSQSYWSR